MVRISDLIIEAHEALTTKAKGKEGIDGVVVSSQKKGEIMITNVQVTSLEGSRAVGKPVGTYITVEIPQIKESITPDFASICNTLAEEMGKVIHLKKGQTALVVGLGNRNITPDAIGPLAVEKIIVTQHLIDYMPAQFGDALYGVCAMTPGVLAATGIESSDMVKAVAKKIKPSVIIVIDALSSRSVARLGTTFQICDTGISPGSGVNNKRKELSEKTLNIPVIAIGVPTVVDGATLTCDIMDVLQERLRGVVAGIEGITLSNYYEEVVKALTPMEQNLMVTPKEVDALVENVSKVLAYGLNLTLQKGMGIDEITELIS